MGIEMTTKKACRYGSRQLQAGEDFTASGQSDAKLYQALGWAEVKQPEPAEPVELPKRSYIRKVMEPVSEPVSDPVSEPVSEPIVDETRLEVPAKRKYQRRDMTAKTDD